MRLLNRRLELVAEIWREKDTIGVPHADPERERSLLQQLEEANDGPLSRRWPGRLPRDSALADQAGARPLMLRVVSLPGDGIGPEVTAVAIDVLRALPIEIEVEEHSFGGRAILEEGTPLPERTLEACQSADAVLLGAVGLPELEGAPVRPEQGLIALRRALDVYANLRPATGAGIDLLIVRELVAGLYYGARGRRPDGSAYDTCEYTPHEIERVARRAFELAGGRRAHVTSVDKVNVLETSRLWRETVVRVAADYPDVELEHMLVDTAGLNLVQQPGALRRDPHREHVRRHPLRRRSRHVRRPRPRGLGEPR